MGGIDSTDQMLYSYLDERRTLKYWRKVVLNIFSRMLLNAYILYTLNCNEKQMSRLAFNCHVVDSLAEEWLLLKNIPAHLGGGDVSPRFGMRKLPENKEKNCSVCSTKEKRKRSRMCCSQCTKGIHPECFNKHKCA